MLIAQVDPKAAPSHAASLVLLGYCAYSITLYIFLHQRHLMLPLRAQPWLDVAFFVTLVALTGGTSSAFYHLFLFAILVASFSRGAREGFAVTLVSVALFATVGLATAPVWPQAELDRALSRAIYLFLLGYMIAYWGGHEFALRRRLNLLREISNIANARLGIEQAAAHNLRRLIDFFSARSALLVLPKPGARTQLIYRVDLVKGLAELPPDEVSEALARPLLSLPPGVHAFVDAMPLWSRGRPRRFIAWEAERVRCARGLRTRCLELAELLEARTFATVPYEHADGRVGRLYLVDPRQRLSEADVAFLAQVVSQIAITVSNVMLVDELATRAAQEERSRISRDIHDTNLQAYIGLKLALEALYRDLKIDSPAAAARVRELLDMASLTVDDLRRYVSRLRTSSSPRGEERLAAALGEQARRYRDFHGIDVALKCDAPEKLDERIGAEACRIVNEALSNVLRHTSAKHAYVDVRSADGALAIEIGNACTTGTPPFVPRSITERTVALGGKVQVRLNEEGHDVVQAVIPLVAAMQRGKAHAPRAGA
jgi:signal transduction histidine kinase